MSFDLNTKEFVIIGPCSLESWEQMAPIAQLADKYQVPYLRTPLFKPRTHPDSFQGLGAEGLNILKQIRTNYPDLKFVAEVGSLEQLLIVRESVEMIQIGARNMQNFELLKSIGQNYQNQFVMLKRGWGNNLKEWLASAQYLVNYGVDAKKIILCERGTRNACAPAQVTLDFALALKAKQMSHFHVIIDPSHGTSDRSMVLPMAEVATALNFDGLMIECHPYPNESYSDAHQALGLEELEIFLGQNLMLRQTAAYDETAPQLKIINKNFDDFDNRHA
ncbi:MAG: hypothetical protein JNM93_06040 [Bacteriovoracaceae bacterium]|nr:hypothetical protein [Bacteriovoracaceae bacterium]